jgi:cytochrome c biogenesis protein CcmG, thiol:disulfide interchange protein DsbE
VGYRTSAGDRMAHIHSKTTEAMRITWDGPLTILVFAGLALILSSCQPGPAAVGQIPEEVRLADMAGRSVGLPSSFRGKVLVIHFWVSSCSLCVGEMEVLESLYHHYSGADVVVCSVNVGDSRGSTERYVERITLSYPIFLDEQSVTRKVYGILGVPATYVLNREGIIAFTTLGPVRKTELQKAIDGLLNS